MVDSSAEHEQPKVALVNKIDSTTAKQQPNLWVCGLITVAIVIGSILINMWLSTHEFARLAGCLGLPIFLNLTGWCWLADGLRFEDTAMFNDDLAGSLYYLPAIPSAITLVSFTSVLLSRLFRPDMPIFTPLLGQFFLAFCLVNVFGCLLVSTRSYALCWRHRDDQ